MFPKKKNLTDQEQRILVQLFVEFLIDNNQPFNLVTNEAFRKFLNALNPSFNIPCENTIQILLESAHQYTEQKLRSLLETDAISVSLTTDFWTSRSQEGYIGITCSWISTNFEPKESLLALEYVPFPHTAEKICESLINTIRSWNLEYKVMSVTTDNGSNMVKAMKLLKQEFPNTERIACAAYTLQLVVNKGLKSSEELQRLILRANRLITFLRKPKQCEHLLAVQQELNYDKILKPIQEVSTRWNSVFYAFERLLELQRAIIFLPSRLKADKNKENNKDGKKLDSIMLSSKEWETLSEIIEILDPFEEITSILSGQNYVTLSLVYPFIKKLTEILKKDLKDFVEVVIYETNQSRGQKAKIDINQSVETRNIINLLKESLLNWISFYWSIPSSIGLISTLLDPRFKDLRNFEDNEKNAIFEHLHNQYEWLNIQQTLEPEPSSSKSRKRSRSIMDSLFSSSGIHSTNTEKNELTKYNELPEFHKETNPLLWWKDRAIGFPNLSKVAREYLAINATSVPSERLFSDAGNQVTSKRSSLDTFTISKILFLKKNRNIMQIFPY